MNDETLQATRALAEYALEMEKNQPEPLSTIINDAEKVLEWLNQG